MKPKMKGTLTLSLIAITFIWIGMVLGISFLEAPLKFTAPGITTKLGVGIGQVVFQALNKVELILSVITITTLIAVSTSKAVWIWYGAAILILQIQTWYLLPVLDARVESILSGNMPPQSYHHVVFIVLELFKILTLLAAGFAFMKPRLTN
jgi:hypothetical protein